MVKIVLGPNMTTLLQALDGPQENCAQCGWRKYPHDAKHLAPRSRKDQLRRKPNGEQYKYTLVTCPGYDPEASTAQPP